MRERCKATTKAGTPCKRTATVDGYCVAHTDDPNRSITKHLVPGPHPGAGRPRRPREIELIQQVADEYKDRLRAVYVDGLEADRALVVGNGPSAHVELVPDHPHRHKVAESIIDRLHGKPRAQEDEHAQPLVNINLISDVETRDAAAALRTRLAVGRSVQSGGAGAGD